jgi:hypothetical protein
MKYYRSIWLTFLVAITPHTVLASEAQSIAREANKIMQNRCMVCHGCYDAPCQLKLEADEGLRRGASKELVYDGTRFTAGNMTRLFDDALTEAQWRDKGFYPVLDSKNPKTGTLYRMLQLKQAHPLATEGPMPEGFDFSLYRDQQCVKPGEFDTYASKFPLWGMPYGFPGLSAEEHEVMTSWLEQGAPRVAKQLLDKPLREQIAAWEVFLNAPDNKSRLMARYVYEHLFLASLYLVDDGEISWFRLVRSTTPPGRNLGLIATRRPYDAPGVSTFYYRLQRMDVTPLDKIHMPYRFDSERLAWYKALFIDTEYTVSALPGYTPEVAANPFRSFQAIPVVSRYRFLLEEAQFTIMNFIKGPVCRGQIALNVIEDHFWIMFVDPESEDPDADEAFLAAETDNLRLPVVRTGTPIDLFYWRRYAKSHAAFQQAKADYLVKELDRGDRVLDMDSIWLGGGGNPNAALTIFRHFDTASVVKGFVGGEPKTAWVIGYSLLERIHYLLVAGFDVYGPVSHQLESRLYMDFLRMEGEFNFLMFMPPSARKTLRDYWYRDARQSAARHMFTSSDAMTRDNNIQYTTDDPKQEFLSTMRARIHGASAPNYNFRVDATEQSAKAFEAMEQHTGAHNSYLPQVSFVNVVGENSDEVFTLLRNSGYSNIAQLFKEEDRRLPDEDSVTVVKGFIGAYPNYFFQVNVSEVGAFVEQVGTLNSDADYVALTKRYGVPRNAAWFWRISDKFHQHYNKQHPIESGLFDYNRYSGR